MAGDLSLWVFGSGNRWRSARGIIRGPDSSVNALGGREGSPPDCAACTSPPWLVQVLTCTCNGLGSRPRSSRTGSPALKPGTHALAYPAARTQIWDATWWADTRARRRSVGGACLCLGSRGIGLQAVAALATFHPTAPSRPALGFGGGNCSSGTLNTEGIGLRRAATFAAPRSQPII